jgi:cytochrome b
MLYKKELGITNLNVKIALKELHVIIGYVFATNLLIRLFFAFTGSASARFSTFIPGKGFMKSLQSYRASLKAGKPQQFIGHNPLGKLAVTALFTLMFTILVSGLIRAGTDVYFPPFGSAVTNYIAAEGTDPSSLLPYHEEGVDKEKMASLEAFKSPFGTIHLYAVYTLMFLIFIHIVAVVRAEVKEGDRLISSMFGGKKMMTEKPQDEQKSMKND